MTVEDLYPEYELREKYLDEPVYMTDTAGRVMRITREQDLGGGVYWLVAEKVPPYGKTEH